MVGALAVLCPADPKIGVAAGVVGPVSASTELDLLAACCV